MAEPAGRPEAPVLLLTKLHPPFVPAQTIARERLFERLRGGRGLGSASSPAQPGSASRRCWRRGGRASRERRPVAWVTLDEGDDDAVVMWSHVIEALGRACPELAHADLMATAAAAPVLEVVLPRLVNELVAQGDVALVLDDFHRLSSPSTRQSVAWFVEHLPSSVQLVLSTRTDPPLPLGALRAHGQLLELRADELRFTLPEAERVPQRPARTRARRGRRRAARGAHRGLAGGHLPRGAVARGHRPTGMRLVTAFDGTSAHVVDFLASEVLAAHEPELQTFMLRTSVLERLCAELCDAVLGRRVGRSARRSWPARTCSCCRSTTGGSGFASTTCSPRSCAWSSSGASRGSSGPAPAGVPVAPRAPARPTRRSTTPSQRARSPRPGS